MKKMDVSNLYDEIKALRNTYVICLDIVRFMEVNNQYGRDAGDKVLEEVNQRLCKAAPDNIVLRIGGDEFVVFTAKESLEDAQITADSILSQNGVTVTAGDNQIPISLRAGVIKIPDGRLQYSALLEQFYTEMDNVRKK